MGQPDNDFTGDYLDTLENPSDADATQDGALPLPTTDTLQSSGADKADDTHSINYEELGKAAATRDFQQAHANGWEYDADAMEEHITKLEDLHNKKNQQDGTSYQRHN